MKVRVPTNVSFILKFCADMYTACALFLGFRIQPLCCLHIQCDICSHCSYPCHYAAHKSKSRVSTLSPLLCGLPHSHVHIELVLQTRLLSLSYIQITYNYSTLLYMNFFLSASFAYNCQITKTHLSLSWCLRRYTHSHHRVDSQYSV